MSACICVLMLLLILIILHVQIIFSRSSAYQSIHYMILNNARYSSNDKVILRSYYFNPFDATFGYIRLDNFSLVRNIRIYPTPLRKFPVTVRFGNTPETLNHLAGFHACCYLQRVSHTMNITNTADLPAESSHNASPLEFLPILWHSR